MRSRGLLFTIIGFLCVGLFWDLYLTNVSFILSLDKLFIFLILFIGLVLTVVSGILIGMGIKIMINPEFYDTLMKLIKE